MLHEAEYCENSDLLGKGKHSKSKVCFLFLFITCNFSNKLSKGILEVRFKKPTSKYCIWYHIAGWSQEVNGYRGTLH